MANTTNLNLEKPIGTDQALVSVINSNMDKIDTFAGSTNQALSNVNNALSGSDIINNQSDKDLNHYITTKAWRIGNVSQLTNGPVWTLAGATGDLYVRANGSYISQLYIGSAGLASRLSADGGETWNDWEGYARKSDIEYMANSRVLTVTANSSTTFTVPQRNMLIAYSFCNDADNYGYGRIAIGGASRMKVVENVRVAGTESGCPLISFSLSNWVLTVNNSKAWGCALAIIY